MIEDEGFRRSMLGEGKSKENGDGLVIGDLRLVIFYWSNKL